jgi:hypothetical protein
MLSDRIHLNFIVPNAVNWKTKQFVVNAGRSTWNDLDFRFNSVSRDRQVPEVFE